MQMVREAPGPGAAHRRSEDPTSGEGPPAVVVRDVIKQFRPVSGSPPSYLHRHARKVMGFLGKSMKVGGAR
jgi:hypothetical protein